MTSYNQLPTMVISMVVPHTSIHTSPLPNIVIYFVSSTLTRLLLWGLLVFHQPINGDIQCQLCIHGVPFLHCRTCVKFRYLERGFLWSNSITYLTTTPCFWVVWIAKFHARVPYYIILSLHTFNRVHPSIFVMWSSLLSRF